MCMQCAHLHLKKMLFTLLAIAFMAYNAKLGLVMAETHHAVHIAVQ